MYIWMVIAAFIAMLYAFNLPHRSDIREVMIAPRAESTIDKIVLQHKAGEAYLNDNVSYVTGTRVVKFNEGEIRFEDLVAYLPYGFNHGKSETGYHTSVYCIDKEVYAENPTYSKALPCNDSHASAYLITYGCIEQRWKSLSGGKPNNDLVNAMKKIVRSGTNFGYNVDADVNDTRNKIKSTAAIQGNLNTWVAIPPYIVNNSSVMGARSFKSVCLENKSQCPYCLVYMTPFY